MLRTNTSIDITPAIFAAHLKCPTKAYLIAHGETPADTFVAYMHRRISPDDPPLYDRRKGTAGSQSS